MCYLISFVRISIIDRTNLFDVYIISDRDTGDISKLLFDDFSGLRKDDLDATLMSLTTDNEFVYREVSSLSCKICLPWFNVSNVKEYE